MKKLDKYLILFSSSTLAVGTSIVATGISSVDGTYAALDDNAPDNQVEATDESIVTTQTALGNSIGDSQHYSITYSVADNTGSAGRYVWPLGINGTQGSFMISSVVIECDVNDVFFKPLATAGADVVPLDKLIETGAITNLKISSPDAEFTFSPKAGSPDPFAYQVLLPAFGTTFPNDIFVESSMYNESYYFNASMAIRIGGNGLNGFWKNLYATVDAVTSADATMQFHLKFVDNNVGKFAADFTTTSSDLLGPSAHDSQGFGLDILKFTSTTPKWTPTNTLDPNIFDAQYVFKIGDDSYVEPITGTETSSTAHLNLQINTDYISIALMSWDSAVNQVTANWGSAPDAAVNAFYNKFQSDTSVMKAIDNGIVTGQLMYRSLSKVYNFSLPTSPVRFNTQYTNAYLGDAEMVQFTTKYINSSSDEIIAAIKAMPLLDWASKIKVPSSSSLGDTSYLGKYPLTNTSLVNGTDPVDLINAVNRLFAPNHEYEIAFRPNINLPTQVMTVRVTMADLLSEDAEIKYTVNKITDTDIEKSKVAFLHFYSLDTTFGTIGHLRGVPLIAGEPGKDETDPLALSQYAFSDTSPTVYAYKVLSPKLALDSIGINGQLLSGKTFNNFYNDNNTWTKFLKFIYGKKPSELLYGTDGNTGLNNYDLEQETTTIEYIYPYGAIPFGVDNFFSIKPGYSSRYDSLDNGTLIQSVTWSGDDSTGTLTANVLFVGETVPTPFDFAFFASNITNIISIPSFSDSDKIKNITPLDVALQKDLFLDRYVSFSNHSPSNKYLFSIPNYTKEQFIANVVIDEFWSLYGNNENGTLTFWFKAYDRVAAAGRDADIDGTKQTSSYFTSYAFTSSLPPIPPIPPVPPGPIPTSHTGLTIGLIIGGVVVFGILVYGANKLHKKRKLWSGGDDDTVAAGDDSGVSNASMDPLARYEEKIKKQAEKHGHVAKVAADPFAKPDENPDNF